MADKLEREIEDVLDKIEDFEWHRRHRRRPSRTRRAWDTWWAHTVGRVEQRLARFTAGHVMLFGFLLLLGGLIFRFRGIGTWLVLAGVIVFVVGLMWNMRGGGKGGNGGRGGRNGPRSGYWRDRYIEYDQPRGAGLRGLLRGKRR